MRVPAETKLGKAKITISFPDLKVPRLAPVVTEVPVVDGKTEKTSKPAVDRHGDPLPPGAIARLGTVRFRVVGQIEELALAPDGKTLAASSWAGVFLFDAISGKRIQSLPASELGEFLRAKPLVFSPDGKRLAGRLNVPVGDRSQFKSVVRVWELGGEHAPRDYDAENVLWVGWSADREPLAVCLEKGALRLDELAAGRARRFVCEGLPQTEVFDQTVRACTATGKTLAVANANRDLIHVWDTDSGKERCTLRLEQGDKACSLALSSDGSKLLSGITNAVQMWDVATRKMLYTIKSQVTEPVPVFTADGNRFAVADSYDTICFRESATGRELGRMRDKRLFGATLGLSSGGPSLGLSSDGKTLATAEYHTGAIHLFDVPTGKRKPAAQGQRGRPHGTFSPDGQRLVTGGSNDATIHVWNLATSESLFHLDRYPYSVRSVAFSADGRSVYSAWEDKDLWISDAATGERRGVIKLEDPERPKTDQDAWTLQLSADGKRLVAISRYNDGSDELLITAWDAATHKQLFRRRLPGPEFPTALSADARVLAAADWHYQSEPRPVLNVSPMRLEDVATGERLLTFPSIEGHTWPQAFSPDGRLLAAHNYNYKWSTKIEKGKPPNTVTETLRLWEIATAAELLMLPVASSNMH